MGNEDHRHALFPLQPLQEVENLGLRGHIQRGGRLVGDEDFWVARERHRDHRALALPTAHLVGIFGDALRRVRNANVGEPLDDRLVDGAVAEVGVQPDRLGELVAEGMHRAERTHWLLKDHRDFAAADGPDFGAVGLEGHQVDAANLSGGVAQVVEDLPIDDAPRAVHDLQDRFGGYTLAAAAFADDPQRFAGVHVERRAVHGIDDAFTREEVRLEIAHLEQRLVAIGTIGAVVARLGGGDDGFKLTHNALSLG